MPVITDISPQKNNKDRVNIYVDGAFYCGVSTLTALDFKLRIGEGIDLDVLPKMLFESEKKTAFDKAMNYIMHGLKTRRQMKEYLGRKAYHPDVIEFVLEYLEEIKYIDDAEYARIYVRESRMKGKALIVHELYQKGIAKACIEEAVEDIDDQSEDCKLLAQKYSRGKTLDMKFKQKMIMYLRNKGFDFDTIKIAVEELYGV